MQQKNLLGTKFQKMALILIFQSLQVAKKSQKSQSQEFLILTVQ